MSAQKPALPPLPYPKFPLRPHRNGQWYKSVWHRQSRRSLQYYFGSWHDDPDGKRAMHDPDSGWLARKDAIHAGIDNVNVGTIVVNPASMTLAELMGRFLQHKRAQVQAGELSPRTLGDYLAEIPLFVGFMKATAVVGGLRPEHFSAYMRDLINTRKLGRHGRKRVRAYINCFIAYGVANGWHTAPPTGVDWKAPATDPASIRVAKQRDGIDDYGTRIVTGEEMNRLLSRATPTYRALLLMAINTGLGPSDLARLRWRMLDLTNRRLDFPRGKNGQRRVGFLWKRTLRALERLKTLKRNRAALERDGTQALVFVSREGNALVRELDVTLTDDQGMQRLVGVRVQNGISRTMHRMCRDLGLKGVSMYRLRHTFRTLASHARDAEAADLMMGHSGKGMRAIYDHSEVEWQRIQRVATVVRHRLWPGVQAVGK